MAEKLTVRTDGMTARFRVGDTTVTPEGVEVSKTELKTIQDAAFQSRVRLYVSSSNSDETEQAGSPEMSATTTGPTDPTTTAQTDTTSGARNKRS